jgi:hypothetical protein
MRHEHGARFAGMMIRNRICMRLFLCLMLLVSSLQAVAQSGTPLTFLRDTLPPTKVGAPYSIGISYLVFGGTPPYRFVLATPASFPPGLSLSEAGQISGIPTRSGTFVFDVTVSDNVLTSVTSKFTLTVDALITLSPATLPTAMLGQPYREVLTASGGVAPYRSGFRRSRAVCRPGSP